MQNVAPLLSSAKYVPASRSPFDAYIVLDFEATCEQGRYIKQPEVIEFPLVVVDPEQMCIVAEFQRYVRPKLYPKLSKFCTELTGITQDMVNRGAPFANVYNEAMQFLRNCGFGEAPPSRSYCLVTCGDWDLKTMLPAQFKVSGDLGTPPSWKRWCNLKQYMKQMQPPLLRPKRGCPCDLVEMLEAVGLPLQGHHHSGIDDCRNIAAVLCELLRRDCVVMPTYSFDHGFQPWRTINVPLSYASGFSLPPMNQLPSSIVTIKPHPENSNPIHGVLPSQESAVPTQASTISKKKKRSRKHPNADAPPALLLAGTSQPGSEGGVRAPAVLLNDSRDAVAEILEQEGNATAASLSSPLPLGRLRTISKLLSYILRHGVDEVGVPITVNGYVELDALLRLPKFLREKITKAEVARVVEENGKQRFRLVYGAEDGLLYICATQGHSLKGVTPDLLVIKRAEEVPLAVHGTNWDGWRDISACGYLSPMSRQYIHFAKGLPQQSGVISGMRNTTKVLLYLDIERALGDGIPIFESSNGVILTSGVPNTRQLPLKYIKKVVNRETGEVINIDTFRS
ncbi:unnamed protein product [Phytomonas sp. EM1]|nr:unnamed protein product [Phytomonas sp. EM1]|eukprot:CCW62518.1 unnamed protein product [Phytomonas sp. isolate EM1]